MLSISLSIQAPLKTPIARSLPSPSFLRVTPFQGISKAVPSLVGRVSTAVQWSVSHSLASTTLLLSIVSLVSLSALFFNRDVILEYFVKNRYFSLVYNLMKYFPVDLYQDYGDGNSLITILAENGDIALLTLFAELADPAYLPGISSNQTQALWASDNAVALYYLHGLGQALDESPLHVAAKRGDIEMAEYFLSTGIDINLQSRDSGTALHVAVAAGQQSFVEFLLRKEGLELNAHDSLGCTVLHTAAGEGYSEILKLLLALPDFDIHERSLISEDTAMEMAIINDHVNCLDVFIARDLSLVTEEDARGWSAINLAAAAGAQNVVERLLQIDGITIESTAGNTRSILTLAAEDNHVDLVRWLVNEAGARVNQVDHHGLMAIHYACLAGNVEVVECLARECGSPLSHEGVGGIIPFHIAVSTGNQALVECFLNQDEISVNDEVSRIHLTALHVAARYGNCDMVRYLLEHGANSDLITPCGGTAREIAARYQHTAIVDLLDTYHSSD